MLNMYGYMSRQFIHVGVPTIVRSDCGTENSCLATCHMLLRHNHDDEFKCEKSFRYGSSTTNTVSRFSCLRGKICIIIIIMTLCRELKVGGLSYANQSLIIGLMYSR